jgi:hypothetical protein
MAGIKTEVVTSRVLMLGDNEFQSGVINIAAGAAVKAGTVLKRNNDGKFAPVVSTEPADDVPGDVPTAVMPFDITNDKEAAADLGFRALVAGRVRADMLRIGGAPTTTAQNDMLRSAGILPVKVTDLSQLDNM